MKQHRLWVLVIGFNRPDLLAQLLASVPTTSEIGVYVSLDGPRTGNSEDGELVEGCRRVALRFAEKCSSFKFRFMPGNLGCRVHVQSAIDWFFSEVSEGVILEDDCLPSPEFFVFASDMLERWRDVPKVMHISGDNSFGVKSPGRSSYGFSDRPLVWGWATWANRWALCDKELASWPVVRESALERKLWRSRKERTTRRKLLDSIFQTGRPDTWDAQWVYTLRLLGGWSVMPAQNLISNTGFRSDGTHTKRPGHRRSNVPFGRVYPIVHPKQLDCTMFPV